MSDYFSLFIDCFPDLMMGLGATLLIAVVSMFFAFIIGMILALMGLSRYKGLKAIYYSYVAFIRGVPVLIFALFLFFGVGGLLNIQFNPIVAGIITLSINASAFLAEIFRGGILAVDKGQIEAARSLGFGYFRTMRYIVLPQAFPAFIAQFIFGFVGGYNNYMGPLLYLSDDPKNYTLQLVVTELRIFYGQQGQVCASCLIALIPLIIVYVIFQRFFIEGISVGGGKE